MKLGDKLDNSWKITAEETPEPFTLVHIKRMKSSDIVPGWWTGSDWDGLKVNKNKDYHYWQRTKINRT